MKLNLTFHCAFVLGLFLSAEGIATEAVFKAGAAKRDITPQEPVPMWGYGARHDLLSAGTLDPLHAAAVVIQAGEHKLAIVGLDLGRSPSEKSLPRRSPTTWSAGTSRGSRASRPARRSPASRGPRSW